MLIPFADSTTTRTGFAGIPWVLFCHRESKRLVGDTLLQLVEGPRVKVCPLRFAVLSTPSDASQVFKDNDRTGILRSKTHDALTDHMINVVLKTSLFARQPFQGAFSTLRAFLLEALSHSPVMTFTLFDLPTADEDSASVRSDSGSKVIHSEVYTDDGLGLLNRCLLGLGFEDDMKIEDSPSSAKSSRSSNPPKVPGLLFAANEGDFLTAPGGAEGNETLSWNEAEISAPFSTLKHDTAFKAKNSRPSAVPVAPHRSIRGGNLTFSRDDDLRGHSEAGSNILISSLMQTDIVRAIAQLMGDAADIVQDIAICLHRLFEIGSLFGSRI